MSLETFQMAQRIILSFNPITKRLGKFERRFKWLNCKYLSTMWNRTDSRFVAWLNNIPDRFLCKADFILSRHFTLLHSRFVKPLNLRTFQENNPCNRKGPRNGQMGKKRNFIPKQNTHDLLVGTLSIGIPSYYNKGLRPDEIRTRRILRE